MTRTAPATTFSAPSGAVHLAPAAGQIWPEPRHDAGPYRECAISPCTVDYRTLLPADIEQLLFGDDKELVSQSVALTA